MVVLDATMLMLLFRPDVPGPKVDSLGRPIDHVKERIDYLVQTLDAAGSRIIIPTPALSEILVRASPEETQQIIERIHKFKVFGIEPFDTRSAIEVAAMTRAALDGGNKKIGSQSAWVKIKYDRQIVAIARVVGATEIFSDDKNIKTIAKEVGIPVRGLAEIALPPEKAQGELELVPPKEAPNESALKGEIESVLKEPEGPASKE
jgi:hypothetical protein